MLLIIGYQLIYWWARSAQILLESASLNLLSYQSPMTMSLSLLLSSFNHIWSFVKELIIFCCAHLIACRELHICCLLQLCRCFLFDLYSITSNDLFLTSLLPVNPLICKGQRVQRFPPYYVTNWSNFSSFLLQVQVPCTCIQWTKSFYSITSMYWEFL